MRTPDEIRDDLLRLKECPAESYDAGLKRNVCYEDGRPCRFPNSRRDCRYFRESILSRAIQNEMQTCRGK